MNPVRDCDGRAVWRVRVVPGEQTCTICGETTTDDYCLRCSVESHANQRYAVVKAGQLVPTMSYLRDDEVERI